MDQSFVPQFPFSSPPLFLLNAMTWLQKEIQLTPKRRGFHLVTAEILAQIPEIAQFQVGVAHLFIKHTSASLAINENADPTVRSDLRAHFDRHLAPPGMSYYRHTYEGPDDATSHIQAVLIGASLTIPITRGRLNMGVWQGIYLCEHRDRGGSRRLVITLWGE